MPPEFLPVLAAGKHRNPRRGACFMEFASLLAGERWSDHPRCTHPVLAALARSVNDVTSDEARPLLAPLVPEVIDAAVDTPPVAPELAALTCRTALEHVHEGHARFVLGVALVSADRVLAEADDEASSGRDTPLSPDERVTAEAYVDKFRVSARFYRRRGARDAVEYAVTSMAAERGPTTDEVLRDLLTRAIARYRELVPAPAETVRPPVDDRAWDAACSRIGTVRSSG